MISVAEALAQIKANALSLETEAVPLDQALGRTLAKAVSAQVTQPPADVSAMDGYAVRLCDVGTAGARLEVIGEVPAGTLFDQPIGPGQAVRIFTGAALPAGADHILIQEEATREGDIVSVTAPQPAAQHVRKAGMDFRKDEILIESGQRLGPAEIAVAAAGNLADLCVYKPPRIAILASGDELRPPGSDLARGEIVNSNAAALSALIQMWGGEAIDLGIARDTVTAIREKIELAADADIILPVGGASVGDHDHMRAAFREAGAEILFEKVAVRPGKPTWFAQLGSIRILGLPGNPASAYVCAHLFLAPLMNSAQEHASRFEAHLGQDLPENGRRETYMRGRLDHAEGRLTVSALPNQDSSLLTPFRDADCLILRPVNDPARPAGIAVTCLPLTRL